MRPVRVSFLAPILVLVVGMVIYLYRSIGELTYYLLLPFISLAAVSAAVYPVGMYEALANAVFRVTDSYTEEESGIVWKRLRRIPLSYVRDVTYDQNFIQAMFGISDITVSATNGDKIVLDNIRDGKQKREIIWKLVLSSSPLPRRQL